MSERAEMYWFDSSGDGRNRFAVFRRVFDVGEIPASTPFHVFADSLYRLLVNGRVCGYGPARFLPSHPEYDTYDIAQWLVAGQNELVVEVNARGASSYQAVPSRGGLAVWGHCGAEDFSLPGLWSVYPSREWDPESDAFSFAQGPVEVRDFRIPSGSPGQPVALECGNHWGELSARSIAYPSLRVAGFEQAVTSAVMESGSRRMGFRCPALPRGRVPFLTNLFSPVAQVVQARMNWGPVALNGQILEPDGKAGHIWEVVMLDFRAGWNVFSGLVENISPRWIWQIDFPAPSGIISGLEPREGSPPGFHLGAHTTDPEALAHFLDDPPAVWDPISHQGEFPDSVAAVVNSPARDMALDFVSRIDPAKPRFPMVIPPGETRALVWDFGGEYLGHPILKIRAPAGTVVDMAYDERLTPSGLIDFYRCNPFIHSADRFVLDGSARELEVFHERGGRYLQVTVRVPGGQEPAFLDEPALRLTSGDYETAGSFESDDPLMNWVWQAGQDTLLTSMADGWIDPWRERGLYLGDVLVQAHAARAMTNDWRLEPWALRLWARAQRQDGQLPDVVPSHHEDCLNDYTLIWILALRNYWAASGDREIVMELLPALERILESPVWREGPEGLWEVLPGMRVFVDWGVVPGERGGTNACLNAFRCRALECAAELMAAAGFADRAEELGRQHRRVVGAFNRHFWIAHEGRFAAALDKGAFVDDPSLHANALALAFGLCEGSRADSAMDYLLSGLWGDRMLAPGHCELYFLYYVFQALYRHGRAGEAEKLIRSHYGLMKENGAWALWECLDRGLADLDSLCHGWSAGVVAFLSERILGVRQIEPGNPRRMLVAPCAETLHRAAGTVPHPDGLIKVSWSAGPSLLNVEIDGPPGVEFVVAPEGRLSKLEIQQSRGGPVGSGT